MRLGPAASVDDDVNAREGVLLQPGASIGGVQEAFSSIEPFGVISRTTTFDAGVPATLTVKAHEELSLESGSHGVVRVHGRLHLSSGNHRFESLDVAPGGELNVENGSGPVLVDVRSELTLAGDVTRTTPARANFLLAYAGHEPVSIAGAMRATLLAPNADVHLLAGASATGALFGRDVKVGPGNTFVHEPFFDERCDQQGRCTPLIPAVSADGGSDALHLRWQTPVPWPGVQALVASVRAAQDTCDAASTNCQNTIDACAHGSAIGGYSCESLGLTCSQANLACVGLRDVPSPPGVARSDDPLLRFLQDPDIAVTLGFDPATTIFNYDGLIETVAGPAVRYRQRAIVQIGGAPGVVPVLGAYATIQLTPDGTSIAGLTSYVVPKLEVSAESVIGEESAIEAAREYLITRSLAIPATLPAPEAVRMFAMRSESDADGRRDRLVYSLTIGFPQAPSFAWLYFVVDAGSGTVLLSEPSTPEVKTADVSVVPADVHPVPLLESALLGVMNVAICGLTDGTGPDRFGASRKISTSRFTVKENGQTALTWGTASCPEGIDRDFIASNDVVTFRPNALGPQQTLNPVVDPAKIHTDPANTFTSPSAVEAQYWGEHVVRWFHRKGFQKRSTPPSVCAVALGADLSLFTQSRIRHLSVSDVGGAVTNNAWWLPHTDLPGQTYCTLSYFNGLTLYGKGDQSFRRSATDPAVVAHEFFHSVLWDNVNQGEKPTGVTRDFVQLEEGLSDCFAMLFTRDRLGDIGSADPNNPALKPHPFHLGRGVYVNASQAEKGAPNLENPADSGEYVYRTWAADRDPPCTGISCLSEDPHLYSSLVSGACKLLVTGAINGTDLATLGTNPNPKFAAIAVVPHAKALPESVSLGANGVPANSVDEPEAFDRLAEVLMETVTARLSSNADFHTLIDAMALSADHLGATQWATAGDKTHAYGERVRRAFSVYGFGRGIESEPNEADLIGKFTSAQDGWYAARNLIAANHTGWSRRIAGDFNNTSQLPKTPTACTGNCSGGTSPCLDEDFFVLNEKVRPGDTIEYSIRNSAKPSLPPQFRVRLFQGNACNGFKDNPKDSTLTKCQKDSQIYPAHDDPSDTDDNPAPNDGSLVMPGTGDAGRVVYLGVMPIKSVPCAAYELKVKLSRRNPHPYR